LFVGEPADDDVVGGDFERDAIEVAVAVRISQVPAVAFAVGAPTEGQLPARLLAFLNRVGTGWDGGAAVAEAAGLVVQDGCGCDRDLGHDGFAASYVEIERTNVAAGLLDDGNRAGFRFLSFTGPASQQSDRDCRDDQRYGGEHHGCHRWVVPIDSALR